MRADKRSHMSDPAPIPNENAVSNKAKISGSPCKTSRAKTGNCASSIAPKNQNHELANIATNTSLRPAANLRLLTISGKGLRLIMSSGSGAGVFGTKSVNNKPTTATTTVDQIMMWTPIGPQLTNEAPISCPVRIPTKVPI